MYKKILVGAFTFALLMGVSMTTEAAGIERKPYGKLPDGTAVDIFTLRNAKGMEITITNYGGIIVSILVPDAKGKMGDVALGFDSLDAYVKSSPYFGCLVGRVGNRIAKGRFTLEGKDVPHSRTNNGPNSLHGGLKGFDKVVWQARAIDGRRARPRASLHEPRRRGRLPRDAEVEGGLHAHRRQRHPYGLRGHDGQDDRRQPHEPRLLQPEGQRRHPRARDPDSGEPRRPP